jgi:hypothetical protein
MFEWSCRAVGVRLRLFSTAQCFGLILLVTVILVAGTWPTFAACYDRDADGHQTRFRLHGGEAVDTRTGLVWQRCSAGNTWNGTDACTGETSYLNLDEAIAAAAVMGNGWHVPSGAELESIVDPACGSPVVDPAIFPDIRPTEENLAKYWTTSPTGMLKLFWNFDFVDGYPDGNSRGIHLAVRFVRSPTEKTK